MIYAAIHIAVRTSVLTLLLLVGIVYVPFVNGKTSMDRLLWIDRPQCVHYPNLNTPAGAGRILRSKNIMSGSLIDISPSLTALDISST